MPDRDALAQPQRGGRKHHFAARVAPARVVLREPTTAFDAMAQAAFQSPNFLAKLAAAIGPEVSLHTIDSWRRGNRRPPQWALDRLYEACSAVRAAADAAMQWETTRAKKEAGD